MSAQFESTAEDVGNIVHFEHVNVGIDDQTISTLFHVEGLGLTRDPYCMTGVGNMWINVGRSQFHLLTGEPGRFNGHVGVVVPNLDSLSTRLAAVKDALQATKFDFSEKDGFVDVVSPWGLELRCFAPDARFGRTALAIPYVEFAAPVGSLAAIAKFYRLVMLATVTEETDDEGAFIAVSVGYAQAFRFRESAGGPGAVGDVHFQMYVANFSAPYAKLLDLGLVSERSDGSQYRFENLVDLDTGQPIMEVGHEVRSMGHPMYRRELVNRDPDHSSLNYVPGYEDLRWALQ